MERKLFCMTEKLYNEQYTKKNKMEDKAMTIWVTTVIGCQLKDAVVEGGVFPSKGSMANTSLSINVTSTQSFNQLFMEAMTNRATLIVKKIVESYKEFENIYQ
ncbi:hypothetical protein Fmac_010733 [Flemingia macrophylla]|uniref:Uncharacterized protein n=1 Tax=Flemingia macrophylla TaxID=520843 RepID=A0ABD1ML61_9FABA